MNDENAKDANSYTTLEVRYLSMNNDSIQVEYTDAYGDLEEAWIPLHLLKSQDFNIFDDIMELEVTTNWLILEGMIDG